MIRRTASRALTFFLIVTILASSSAFLKVKAAEEKPPTVSVESFVSSLDRDGDGEICTEEANKFLESVLDGEEVEDEVAIELTGATAVARSSIRPPLRAPKNMADFMNDHNLDISFNYGGSSISASEMTDHLEHMLTGDRVVAWVIHGLGLPQYAEAFKKNSIDGLDFPTLISENGDALRNDLGVASSLHRQKIQSALVRQVFGIGKVPGAPVGLNCRPMEHGGAEGILLQWRPPAELGVPPLHKYLVRRRTVGLPGVHGKWEELGDTSDESWWDAAGLDVRAGYEYRVQSWGGHGPSSWANVTGCSAASGPSALVDQNPPMHALSSSAAPIHQPEAALAGPSSQENADVAHAAASSAGHHQAASDPATSSVDTFFDYAWSLNGGILLLGLLSRSSLLFKAFSFISSAAWNYVARRMPSLNSSSVAMRRLAHAIFHMTTAVNALGQAIMAAFGLGAGIGPEHLHNDGDIAASSQRSGFSSGRSSSLESRGTSDAPYPFSSSSTSSQDAAVHITNLRHRTTSPAVPNGPMHSSTSCHTGSTGSVGSENSSTEDGRSAEASQDEVPFVRNHSHLKLAAHDMALSSKNRCNMMDCPVQFNTLSGFRESLKKHYCRDCQSWYCSRHTRISSHTTQLCRFDSQCRCHSCYARLPADAQLYLESINKLAAPKPKRDVTVPLIASPIPSRKGRTSPGGVPGSPAVPYVHGNGAMGSLLKEGTLVTGEDAANVRRAVSDQMLEEQLAAAHEEPSSSPGVDVVGRTIMRKSVSSPNVDRKSNWGRSCEQDGCKVDGMRSHPGQAGEGVTGALLRSSPQVSSKSFCEPDAQRFTGGVQVCSSWPHLSHGASFERIDELDAEGAGNGSPEAAHTGDDKQCAVGHQLTESAVAAQDPPSTNSLSEDSSHCILKTLSNGMRGPATMKSSSGGESRRSLCQVPSFGRSRSLRTEDSSLSRSSADVQQGRPATSVGSGCDGSALHHRCNSLEGLNNEDVKELETEQKEVDKGQQDSTRKLGKSVKSALRKGMNSFTNLLPGGPRGDEPPRGLLSKVKDFLPMPKATTEGVRTTVSGQGASK